MRDLLKLALRNLLHRKLRSYLTIIGVVIGVASVVSFISISQGMDAAIREIFGKFGSDKIIIMPGSLELGMYTSLMGSDFTDDELKLVSRTSGVELAIGLSSKTMVVEYRGEQKSIPVYGIPTHDSKKIFETVQGYQLESGRYFLESDKYRVILGHYIAHSLFDREIRTGVNVKINGKRFRVIGVMEETGSRMDDAMVVIPMSAFKELTGRSGSYSTILVKVKSGKEVESVAEKIKHRLEKKRESFTVMTSQQMAKKISSILGIVGLVLVAIASISILVGSVGIMNTMYMSVMERTREIGVMKAVGAAPSQILMIFLIESGMIGFFGGVLGCFIGFIGAEVIENIARASGYGIFRAYVSPELILFSLIFSTAVGLLSGYFPAKHAASLDPVKALRYE